MATAYFLELFAAGVAGGGLIINGIALWRNANARYLSTLQEFTKEIRRLWGSGKFCTDYTNWGIDILNELNKIAFLARKKKINRSLVGYFDNDFSYGCGLLNLAAFKNYNDDVPDLKQWCDSHRRRVKELSNTIYDNTSSLYQKNCKVCKGI